MPRLPLPRPAIAIALACLTMLVAGCWREWVARDQQIRATETSVANLANSLARDASATVEVADTFVAGIVTRLETEGTGRDALGKLNEMLPVRVASGTRIDNIVVLDKDGNWLASSLPEMGKNMSDRDLFKHGRDSPDQGPFVGHPLLGRATGRWLMTVSRRFQDPDGNFAGIVLATIRISNFADHFAELDLGPNSQITLFMNDGTLVARYPWDLALVGRNMLTAQVFTALRQSPAGSYETDADPDGVKRFSGYHRSDRYPLIVVAAVSANEALCAWRNNAILHIAITLVMTIGVGLLGLHLIRQARRSQTAEQALRKSEQFLDRASRLAGVGGWEIDLVTNEASWSAEILSIYGLKHEDMPKLRQSIEYFAPEARPVIFAAFERCRRHGEGWDLELPFDRADGARLWVRSVGTPILVDGVPARVIGAMQDITNLVVERLALEAANERVTLATESGRIGIWDWDIPSDTLAWDRWMYRLYGMERPAGAETYEFWRQHVHPDDLEAAEQTARDAREGGKPYLAEFRIIWADGSVHHIRAAGRVTRDAAGNPIRMLGANWDFTELAAQNLLLAQAEREAATSAAQYRLLADNSTDMIFIIDRQHKRSFVSPASLELLGYTPEELTGVSPIGMIHPDDAPRLSAIFTEMFAGRETATNTLRSRHRDGHWVWVDAVLNLARDPDSGEPMEICGSLRDVTTRVAAETALRESEERYRLLLESGVTEAFYLLDPSGIVETWNAGAERIKGWAPDEIIGRDFATFFTPEDIASGEPARLLALARDTGKFAAEGWRVRKDGSRFLADGVIEPIHAKDGTLRGFARVSRDITDRRIEEEQRAIILESTPTGIMIVDEAGAITLANSHVEQMFGYPIGALAGQQLEILLPEAMRAMHRILRSAFAGEQSVRPMAAGRAVAGRRQDGTVVLIEVMLRPVKTPRGAIVVASLSDVTDRQQRAAAQQEKERQERLAIEATNVALDRLARDLAKARDAAERASLAKTRFLAGMSHELRTPLNGILGYAQLLHMEGGLNTTQAARIDAMLEAGKHLLGMIARVLDMSEIESEHVEMLPATFAVLPVAEACMDLIRPAAEAKGLTLSIIVAPHTPRELTADVTRLRQVLLNLLGNAAKFTCNGAIALRLRPRADGLALRIEVADTGPGIPPDQRQRLFQDFERLDTEATRAADGAGLGLALSARLATLMGGRLDHEDNPGGGSVFWLELPLNATATAPPPDPPQAPATRRALHVLVVDDAEMNRDVAGSFLRAAGHQVTVAASGAQAVEAVANADFDAVLMDVRMPGMDGLEATRRIRGLDGRRGCVPIVALTAQTFSEQVAACRAAGMDGHVGKPFDMEELVSAIARVAEVGHRPADAPAVPSAAPVPPDAPAQVGSDLPVLDPKQFAVTTASLTPRTAAAHMRTLLEIAETLLHELDEPDAVSALADTAHKLAGSAGLFGFKRLATIVRQLEHTLQADAADVPALADALRAAIKVTRAAIGDQMQLDVQASAG